VRDTIFRAFKNGVDDRRLYGLLRKEQLYRKPWTRRAAWRLGWELANVVTRRPLRTAKKKAA
jgi:hypothetical protein